MPVVYKMQSRHFFPNIRKFLTMTPADFRKLPDHGRKFASDVVDAICNGYDGYVGFLDGGIRLTRNDPPMQQFQEMMFHYPQLRQQLDVAYAEDWRDSPSYQGAVASLDDLYRFWVNTTFRRDGAKHQTLINQDPARVDVAKIIREARIPHRWESAQ